MKTNHISQYCRLMEEIKRRTNVVYAFLDGRCTALYKATTLESISLQIRKILELIALGSLVVNKKEYSAQHEKFNKHWHAARILRDIEALNPNFYPKPIKETPSKKPGVKTDLIDVTEGFLTKEKFINIYAKCGGILHADNPFGSQTDFGHYEREIPKWMAQIRNLLNTHGIQLVNDENLYLIHMQGQDGKAHGYTFSPVKGPM